MCFDVSIVIPVYNGEEYLERCLETIVNRSPQNVQVVLIDDGSTDSSASICDDYCGKYGYISVYHIENGGVSNARNLGVSKAKGEYIFFLDADDYLSDDWNVIINKALEKYSSDMVIFAYQIINSDGQKGKVIAPFTEGRITDIDVYECLIASADTNACWGKLIKKNKILDNNVLFKVGMKIGEDVDFQVELLPFLDGIYYCDDIVIEHFDNPVSVMNNFKLHMFDTVEESYNIRNRMVDEVAGISKEVVDRMYDDLIRTFLSYIRKMCKNYSVVESEKQIELLHNKVYVKDILSYSHRLGLPMSRKVIATLMENKCYTLLIICLKVIG